MDFFQHQQQARVGSRRLIFLFAVAVIGIVVAVNVAAALLFRLVAAQSGLPALSAAGPPAGFYLATSATLLLLIGGGTAFEIKRLASGGEAVAAMVGARPLDPAARDTLERRLLNVVEEMALASGVPVPRVYVMDGEDGINAFAAGHHVNDAVIAVTRGALVRLTREELQGVVAHEFSHILNGDMALNLRLIGLLFGVLMIAMFGRVLLELGRGEGRAGAVLASAGLALWILGYLGVFCGRLIKAGVARQREYLADASAVQFTRQPDGIGGALRKIGGLAAAGQPGSRVVHPQAEALSHLFLGAAGAPFVAGLFATHPPLAERIRRIYGGRALPPLQAPELPPLAAAPAVAPSAPAAATARSPLGAWAPLAAAPAAASAALAASVGQPAAPAGGALLRRIAAELGLDAAASDSTRAPLLVLAMLLDKTAPFAARQQDTVAAALGAAAAAEVERLHAAVRELPPGLRLPLLDCAMPALRKSGAPAAGRLLDLAQQLIRADGRVTLPEFLLYTVLARRLGPRGHGAVAVRFRRLDELHGEVALVLSLIAWVRQPQATAAAAERALAAGRSVLGQLPLPLLAVEALALDRIGTALDRLNELAPLAKPALIRAAAAVAFSDGAAHWPAISCVRTLCVAIDAPLPPQIDAAAQPAAGAPA